MQIVIGNLPPEATVEDIQALLSDEIGLNDFGSITLTEFSSATPPTKPRR